MTSVLALTELTCNDKIARVTNKSYLTRGQMISFNACESFAHSFIYTELKLDY